MKLMDLKFSMINIEGSTRCIYQFHKTWESNSNLAGETEVESRNLGLERLKQIFFNTWMNEWMKKFSSTVLDLSRNLDCHGYAWASTASILQEFYKILLQSTSIMHVDDEHIESKEKDMKKIDEKIERNLRANFQIWNLWSCCCDFLLGLGIYTLC